RGWSPTLRYLSVTDSVVGLRLTDGAAPSVIGSSFLRNGIGIDASGSTPTISSTSQFVGNTTNAILNRTPATLLTATGNWLGAASGPRDAAGNPSGQGDPVSTGVNYGAFVANAPLINPTVRLATPAPYFDTHNVPVVLTCTNATEYRVAEGGGFSGMPF